MIARWIEDIYVHVAALVMAAWRAVFGDME